MTTPASWVFHAMRALGIIHRTEAPSFPSTDEYPVQPMDAHLATLEDARQRLLRDYTEGGDVHHTDHHFDGYSNG